MHTTQSISMPSRDELSMLSWHAEQTQAQNTGNKLACKSNAALRKHEQKLACNNFGTKQGEMGSVQTATHRGVGTAWMWLLMAGHWPPWQHVHGGSQHHNLLV